MSTVSLTYRGDLRVECTHNASGTTLLTDAPVDNHGRGEGFSPTDLCATALGACALTIIGIHCKEHGIDLDGATVDVTKAMSASPRRIGRLEVIIHMPPRGYSESQRAVIEACARSCPVCLSLHPGVEQRITFDWMA
ncbi:MAG: OsmC family protein [Desulfovibrionaceae bacterium]|nr:OsmC family protein [Desulfovibrionaceae bacterium]